MSGDRLIDPSTEQLTPEISACGSIVRGRQGKAVFAQGDPADSVFLIQDGTVKLSAVSEQGRVAVLALIGAGEYFGEGCLAGQIRRMATASAITNCILIRFDKAAFWNLLQRQTGIRECFLAHLLARNVRFEEDLMGQFFHSSEKRLARTLLSLARLTEEHGTDTVIPRISQETLAEMIGTTRSRVNVFLGKFRKLGLIEYSGRITVHRSRLELALRD